MVGFEDVCGVRAARELCVRPVCAYCVSLYGIYEDVSRENFDVYFVMVSTDFLKKQYKQYNYKHFQFYYIGLVLGW